MFHTADALLALAMGNTIYIPLQKAPARGYLHIMEATLPSSSLFVLNIVNTEANTVTLLQNTILAKGIVNLACALDVLPETIEPILDDIRLRPEYFKYINARLHCDSAEFTQVFHNGADFQQDHWSRLEKAWINPPWHYLPQVIDKLLLDTPVEWILICPVFQPTPEWYKILHQADNLVSLLLPRSLATGYFLRFANDQPIAELPFPEWEVEVVRGNISSFLLLDPEIRQQLLQMSVLAPTVSSTTWQQNVKVSSQASAASPDLLRLLQQYEKYIDGSVLGCTSAAQCPIPLVNETPINIPQYRLSRVQNDVVAEEVQKMLSLGVIEPSVSPWNFPILVIPKKDGTLRFCADLRKLNERTVKDVYPFPDLQQTLDKLGQNLIFSTIDLKSGYWQVCIPPEDRPKTAFSTSKGHFQWVRAPFGFCNMPSIFQRMMTRLLQDCSAFTLVYLDDIVIFSKSVESHLLHLQQVLQHLVTANLTLNLKKCQFMTQTFSYLGHLIDQHGIHPNPDKVAALRQLSPPTNRQQLMQFLGLANWFKRFIPNLAQMASTLYPLVSKQATWTWTVQEQTAFDQIKTSLTSNACVKFPDFTKTFVLVCDASDKQIGAVLLQPYDRDLYPIYYYSHVLDKHQQSYSVTEKECLAIVLAIKHFHVYLHGVFFIVRTDHRALVWLYKAKDQFSKLLRWSIFLQQYNFLIVYGKGQSNVVADALSRLQTDPSIPVDQYHEYSPEAAVQQPQAALTTVADPVTIPAAILQLVTFRNPAQTKTSGPRDEQWLHRQVQVLGSWFNNNSAKKMDLFTMEVVEFIEGPTLRKDRWKVRLKNADGSPDEYFHMSFNAMCKYLLPNVSADVPAHRLPTPAAVPPIELPCDLPSIDDFIVQQNKDPSLQIWFNWLRHNEPPIDTHVQRNWWLADKDVMFLNEAGLLCRFASMTTSAATRKCSQVIVPTDFIPKVLHLIHGSDTFGHQGFSRSLFQLRSQYFWPHMRDQLLRHIQSCTCQGVKTPGAVPTMFPDSILATSPNVTIAVDCTGPLPLSTAKNSYILVLQDVFTKYTELIPLSNIHASTVASAILNVWILRYGPMKRLLSDNGTEFANVTLRTICSTLAIKKVFVSPMHPQGNGQIERMMSTIKRLITSQSTVYPMAWDCYLPRLQYIYNGSIHKSTAESPYFLWFARVPPSFQPLTDNLLEPDPAIPISLQRFKNQLIHHLLTTSSEVAAYHIQHHAHQPEPAVQTTFDTGDLVWLEDRTQSKLSGSRKLTNFWTGPFLVLQVLNNRNIRLLRPTTLSPRAEIQVSVDRLRKYIVPTFQPWMLHQSKFRFPLFILAKRVVNGQVSYKVQWLSQDETSDTWEPADKLPLQMVFNYEQLLRNKSYQPQPQLQLPLQCDNVED
jgi:hypothetical protein